MVATKETRFDKAFEYFFSTLATVIIGVLKFFASLCCQTFDCTKEKLKEMGIEKGYIKSIHQKGVDAINKIDMSDDIRLDEDPRA